MHGPDDETVGARGRGGRPAPAVLRQRDVATAGGCLASPYLAAWLIARLVDVEAAESALHYVAPVGEKDDYVLRAMRNIAPYLVRPAAVV